MATGSTPGDDGGRTDPDPQPRRDRTHLLYLSVIAAVAAMTSAVAVSTVGKAYLAVVSDWWDNLVFQLGHLF